MRPPGPGADDVYLVNTVTDLQLLEDKVAQAHRSPSSEALALLLEGLALVEGVPFDDLGYEWAIDRQLTARAAVAIETAALQAVELALGCDDVVAARSAVSQALKGLPGNELLYRARMQIEAHAGNRAGVHAVYEELVRSAGGAQRRLARCARSVAGHAAAVRAVGGHASQDVIARSRLDEASSSPSRSRGSYEHLQGVHRYLRPLNELAGVVAESGSPAPSPRAAR